MLDVSQLKVKRQPFCHLVGQIIPADQLTCLRSEIVGIPLAARDHATRVTSKRYRVANCVLIQQGSFTPVARTLRDTAMGELLDEVTSTAYADALMKSADVNLRGSDLHVRLCCHGPGCFMEPHTDRASIRFTQVIYLNEASWDPTAGGQIQLLSPPPAQERVTAYVPIGGRSVGFAPSSTSWHEVRSVGSGVDRWSLLLHFGD